MKKIFIFLLLFFILPTYADVFTGNVVDGCEQTTLGIASNVIINAKFEPIQITCGGGQYLPAKSTVCVNCPNEATCSPGTYAYSETKNQGIVYNDKFQENKPVGCVSNLLGLGDVVMVAKFVPNTINLDWFNGNETIAQTTCEYNGTIQLPPDPVKPGYTFVGWRLRQ